MQSLYVKRKKFIVNIIFVMLLIFIVYVALKYALGLISPFLFAFLIAFMIKKPARFLSSRLKLPYKPISFALVLLFYCTVGVLISLLGVKLISSATAVIIQIPAMYENQLEPFLTDMFNGIEQAVFRLDPALVTALQDSFDQFVVILGERVTNISLAIVGAISNLATMLPGFLIKVLLMIISTFFIASDYDALSEFVLKQFNEKGREVILQIKQYLVETLFVVIRSYGLIMSITFVEMSIGLSVIGIPNAVLVALLISVFDILPVLGTGGIMIPWTIITLFQGNY
ncbi:MAG: AI-2E family transporter, partial [Eubacteriales bacterium]|nr:AI-2E family transporter [Eubacteriales bacterium]